MTITGQSSLDKSVIDQMIKDAEAHADEDRKQRELAEARNVAENAAYTAEKQVADLGDQLADDEKADIESQIAAIRESLDSADADDLNAKTEALQTKFHSISERIYQAAAAEGAQNGADGAASPNGATADADAEEVVDAEVVDEERS